MKKEAVVKKTTKLKTTEVKKEKNNRFKAFKYELSKVKWPERKDIFKYSVATLVLCLFLVGFFMLLDLIASFIKGMFV